jgi:hypothetical protein
MKLCEKSLKTAARKLRKLRMSDVGGRKEHACETITSIFKAGLGNAYSAEAVDYMLRFGVKYYLEEKNES